MAAVASVLYDPIMDALLARLKEKCGDTFLTYSRRIVTWEQMIQDITNGKPTVRQPALYLYDGVGFGGGLTQYVQGGRTPAKRSLIRTIVIYNRMVLGETPGGIDLTTAPGSTFYRLIEAIEAALEPEDADQQATVTLGGLVTHCWIEGDGVIVTGDIDPNGQGMATLPINILIP